MGENTLIEWCRRFRPDGTEIPGHSFNIRWGCTPVSPACNDCYAESMDKRFGGNHWGPHAERKKMTDEYWQRPLEWGADLDAPGDRAAVFCSSMADVFENVEDGQLERLWPLIEATPRLDWLLLTKRPQNMARLLPDNWGVGGWPNVWLGVTAENQAEAERRIPILLATPAARRFASCEPLLEKLELRRLKAGRGLMLDALSGTWYTRSPPKLDLPDQLPGLDWVIGGGKTGGKREPTHPDWMRGLRDQCEHAGVPFFLKRWGDYVVPYDGERACRLCGCTENWACAGGCSWAEPDLCSACVGKPEPDPLADRAVKFYRAGTKKAGRALDGREHDDMPDWAALGGGA